MASKISASVGKGGKNKPEDVQIVQELLNDFAKQGGYKKLDVDGLVGSKTISAIGAFQKEVVGLSKCDSRVDPSGETMSTLSKGPKKVEAEAKKAEKEEEKAAKKEAEKEGGSGKPQVKGETGGINRKILGLLEAVSAHYNKPIVVVTGKLSGGPAQGEQVWDGWVSKLKRGTKDPYLKQNKSLCDKLNSLYESMKRDDFLQTLSQKSGGMSKASLAHASGNAIDIKSNTDNKVVAALASILRKEDEGDVIHFDDTGCNVPSTITDSIKKKWK